MQWKRCEKPFLQNLSMIGVSVNTNLIGNQPVGSGATVVGADGQSYLWRLR